MTDDPAHDLEHLNQVVLVGRLGAAAATRTLPSGDTLSQFRLIVPRPPERARQSRVAVDTLDCAAWTSRLRRQVSAWGAGRPGRGHRGAAPPVLAITRGWTGEPLRGRGQHGSAAAASPRWRGERCVRTAGR